jgi:hypothetical protein
MDSMVNGYPTFTEDEIVKENVKIDSNGSVITLNGLKIGSLN